MDLANAAAKKLVQSLSPVRFTSYREGERAKLIGGKLEVCSANRAGTEIELIVPAGIAYGKFDVRRGFWFSPKN